MKTMNPNVRRWIAVVALVVIALLSAFVLAGRLSDPAFHAASIAVLDEKGNGHRTDGSGRCRIGHHFGRSRGCNHTYCQPGG